MTVTEVHQGDGDWRLRVREGAPGDITDALRTFAGIVRIYPTPIPTDQVGTVTPLYSGVLLDNPSLYEAGGAGPNWYLGESSTGTDQFGPVMETAIAFTSGTLTDWATEIATRSGLGVGTLGATASTWTGSLQYVTPRTVLDPWIKAAFAGHEYRVTADLELEVGTAAELATSSTPTVIVSLGDVGRDYTVEGVNAPQLDLDASIREWTMRVHLDNGPTTGSATAGSNPYSNPAGDPLLRRRHVENTQVPNGDISGWCTRLLNLYGSTRKSLSVSLDDYMVSDRVRVADYVWVFDVDRGLYDTANKVTFAGRVIFPVKLRVLGLSWPITEGMGVYLDNTHQGGSVTDLTEWVAWESGAASMTVGSLPRRLGYLRRPV